MPRVLMNFQRHNNWVAHFIEADCKTTIGRRTRFFEFATEEGFRTFVSRCNLENPADFEDQIDRWSRGSAYAHLTDEQYKKLRG